MIPTAAAKSLQSCPTLCDPIDSSPPGSSVPGSLQARTLEWVAISFSNARKWKVKVKLLSRVQLLATPWTAAYQAPPSMGFSRQEYWSGAVIPRLQKKEIGKRSLCYCMLIKKAEVVASGVLFQAANARGDAVGFPPDHGRGCHCLNLSLLTLSLRSIGSKDLNSSTAVKRFWQGLETWAQIRKDLINRTTLTHGASTKNRQ